MLTSQQIAIFKQRLMDIRDHILDRIDRIDQGGISDTMSESFGELSTYDNHPADVGSEMFERGKDFALREEAMLVIGAIDDALDKIQKGQYGRCEVCGKDIPIERLDAIPYTTQCVNCKSQDEHLPKSQERTAEEDVLDIPFSRSWKDEEADWNGFDGEDSWEIVARWNEHADRSRAGSYYGDEEMTEEQDVRGGSYYGDEQVPGEQGILYTDVDTIPYEVDDDGVTYQSFRVTDDESAPEETEDPKFS